MNSLLYFVFHSALQFKFYRWWEIQLVKCLMWDYVHCFFGKVPATYYWSRPFISYFWWLAWRYLTSGEVPDLWRSLWKTWWLVFFAELPPPLTKLVCSSFNSLSNRLHWRTLSPPMGNCGSEPTIIISIGLGFGLRCLPLTTIFQLCLESSYLMPWSMLLF